MPEFGDVGKDLNSAADLAIDAIILISKSAVKNIKMGLNFGTALNYIIEAINSQIDILDHEKSFKLFHKVALFKQLAQNVWHGSVIGSILDGNLDLINMTEIGIQISNSVDLKGEGGQTA